MSREHLGDACAYFPPEKAGEKARYPRIGSAFRDGDRISVKIDSIPLGNWGGWINIFPPKTGQKAPVVKELQALMDDDIPF